MLQESCYFRVTVHQLLPDKLAEHEALDLARALKLEKRLLIFEAVPGSDDAPGWHSDDIARDATHLVANVNETLLVEQYFLDQLELLIENGVLVLKVRLKVLQQFDHKIPVDRVVPVVEDLILFWDFEVVPEAEEEIVVQILFIQLILNELRELIEEHELFWIVN